MPDLDIYQSTQLDERWFACIEPRHSRRVYSAEHVPSAECLEALRTFCTNFSPFPHARIEFLQGKAAHDVFASMVPLYGVVKNAPAAFVFIGKEGKEEQAGYTGECAVLEATRLGLNTCWIGGTYNKKAAAALPFVKPLTDEKILAVSPVGYALDKKTLMEKAMGSVAGSRTRKELTALCPQLAEQPGLFTTWPLWVQEALQAARLAPSGLNSQTWRFVWQKDVLSIGFDTGGNTKSWPFAKRRLDCGIAMAHIELGALTHGVHGTWRFAPSPDVAMFQLL